VVEDALVSYLESHGDIEYSPSMVHVCLTLCDWMFTPPSSAKSSIDLQENQSSTIMTAFNNIMTIMHWTLPSASTLSTAATMEAVTIRRTSHFMSLFRKLMPDLASYFDEEQFNGIGEEWVRTWITWWCARELSTDEKARLWDFYLGYRPSAVRGADRSPPGSETGGSDTGFSSNSEAGSFDAACQMQDDCHCEDGDGEDEAIPLSPPKLASPTLILSEDPSSPPYTQSYTPADWHTFVCLAMLKSCKDALEELELSEIRTLLTRMPRVGIEGVMREAGRMRVEYRRISEQEEREVERLIEGSKRGLGISSGPGRGKGTSF
jgi:Rab-GTPase-TBC domain